MPSIVTIGLASSVQVVDRIQTPPVSLRMSLYKARPYLSWGPMKDPLVSLNVKLGDLAPFLNPHPCPRFILWNSSNFRESPVSIQE